MHTMISQWDLPTLHARREQWIVLREMMLAAGLDATPDELARTLGYTLAELQREITLHQMGRTA